MLRLERRLSSGADRGLPFSISFVFPFFGVKPRSGWNWMERTGRSNSTGASYGQACVEAALISFLP